MYYFENSRLECKRTRVEYTGHPCYCLSMGNNITSWARAMYEKESDVHSSTYLITILATKLTTLAHSRCSYDCDFHFRQGRLFPSNPPGRHPQVYSRYSSLSSSSGWPTDHLKCNLRGISTLVFTVLPRSVDGQGMFTARRRWCGCRSRPATEPD